MAKTYTGTVIDGASRKADRVVIELPAGERPPKPGSTVRLTELIPDSEIGKQLRELLDGIERESVNELAETISDYAGWPALADLIREVGP